MKLLTATLLSALLFSACTDQIDDDLGETEQASTPLAGQGTFYNGTFYNGTFYNGTFYNGTFYNGTFYNGATYGGSAVSDAIQVAGTTITVWRQIFVISGGGGKTLPTYTIRWEQRSPSQICTWDQGRTQLIGCTQVTLNNHPSPLTGVGIPATFTNPTTGNTVNGTMYIGGQSTTTLGAVASDTTTMAMHPLTGASSATPVPYNSTFAGARCDNPNGCRANSDLWLYAMKLWDPSTSTMLDFCPDGARAIALAGVWDSTGKFTSDPSKFTFACTNGTIAKCTRWGYRRWTSAARSDGSGAGMADYHQACVRAATADYCANGHSFTVNGTMVDVYDYEPQQPGFPGFIPRTVSVEYQLHHPTPNAFVWESSFDTEGAVELDFLRYMELAITNPQYGNVESVCPGRFSPPTAPEPNQLHRPYWRTSPDPVPNNVRVRIDNTVVCSHSEQTTGKWLHPTCSDCTHRLWELHGLGYSCISPAGSWTPACVQAANQVCTAAYPKMASHSECQVSSTPLNRYDSACTIKVCAANAACCSNSWSQSCVDTANAQCTGGSEQSFHMIGFCGTSILVGNG